MKYNKLIAALLAASMSLSLMGTAAMAADEETVETLETVETPVVAVQPETEAEAGEEVKAQPETEIEEEPEAEPETEVGAKPEEEDKDEPEAEAETEIRAANAAISLQAERSGHGMTVTVVSGDGTPCVGASVTLQMKNTGYNQDYGENLSAWDWKDFCTVTTGPDGRAEFQVWDGVDYGYVVTAKGMWDAKGAVTGAEKSQGSLEITMESLKPLEDSACPLVLFPKTIGSSGANEDTPLALKGNEKAVFAVTVERHTDATTGDSKEITSGYTITLRDTPADHEAWLSTSPYTLVAEESTPGAAQNSETGRISWHFNAGDEVPSELTATVVMKNDTAYPNVMKNNAYIVFDEAFNQRGDKEGNNSTIFYTLEVSDDEGKDEVPTQTVDYTVQHIYSTGYTYADAAQGETETKTLTAQVGEQNLAPIQPKDGFALTTDNSIICGGDENLPDYTVGDDGAYTFTGVKGSVVVTYRYFKAVPVKVDFQMNGGSGEDTAYDVYYRDPMSSEAAPQGLGEDQTVPNTLRAGHLFLGWRSSLGETLYQAEDVAGMAFANDVTFTAQWAPLTTVSIYHYYINDGGYVDDDWNGDPVMMYRQDGQDGKAVNEALITSVVRDPVKTPDGRYHYTSFEVLTMPEGAAKWEPAIYELEGDLDLTGLTAVSIHLVYDPYYTVSTSVDEHGSVTATDEYMGGRNVEIKASADEGYHIDSVTLDGEAVGLTNGTFLIPAIKADHTVVVTTAKDVTVPPADDNNNGSGSNDNSGNSDRDDRPVSKPTEPDNDVEITDPETPLAPLPEGGDDTSVTPPAVEEETIDIGDSDVPMGNVPTDVDDGSEIPPALVDETVTVDDSDTVVILDQGTPMGNLPQTGTLGASESGSRALAFLALTGAALAAGMAGALVLVRKKEDAE